MNPKVLPSHDTAALVEPLQLRIGLYIAPNVRKREFAQGLMRSPTGQAVAETFEWAVRQSFSTVVVLEAIPSVDQLPVGLTGILELSDFQIEGTVTAGTTGGLTFPTTIRYDVTFHSVTGEPPDHWSVLPEMYALGYWDRERSSPNMQSLGSALSYAIRNQTAVFMIGLRTQPAIQRWLREAQAKTDASPFPAITAPLAGVSPTGLLLLPNVATWQYSDIGAVYSCIGRRLSDSTPPLKIIVGDDPFRLHFFPWLEFSTGPISSEAFIALMAEPAIRARLRNLGARYLIDLRGGTKTSVDKGGILCGGGFGAGGCLGFAWGVRDSSFVANIIDIENAQAFSALESKESTGVYIPAFLLPIPLLAPTESIACDRLAREIHRLIAQ